MHLPSSVSESRSCSEWQTCVKVTLANYIFWAFMTDLLSNRSQTWLDLGTQIRTVRIWNNSLFGSQNNTPDKTNSFNNVVICYKEAVQCSASFAISLFASFWLNLWNSNGFYQRVSIASYASAGIARAEMSVRLSVRPSHSGIVSKRRKLVSWFLHHPRAWTF